MKKTCFVLAASMLFNAAMAQNIIDSVLNKVLINNKFLGAQSQLLETRQLQERTGLNPENPTISYDYLFGTPANLGDQTDIIISQGFDFPSAYAKRKKISRERSSQFLYQNQVHRQNTLLEAKEDCIELIYLNKHIKLAQNRLKTTQKAVGLIEKRVEVGETNVVEANKAKLLLLNIDTKLRSLQSQRKQVVLHLTELNGGLEVDFRDTQYPAQPIVPNSDSLEALIEAIDPLLKIYENELALSELQLELSRSLKMPKLEGGYHYQSILGQTFNGLHLGMSIPLWENQNTLKYSRAYKSFTQLEVMQHRTEHQFEIKELYQDYLTLRQNLADYTAIIESLQSEQILLKSLEAQQISFIDYAMELQYYYQAYDHQLILERDLNKTIAKLYKYEL